MSEAHAPMFHRHSKSEALRHRAGFANDVLRSAGEPLPKATRLQMERHFQHDFSRVRVHTDGRAALSAASLRANAFTVGNHVVFGTGQFNATSGQGQRLLRHELTHVIQQGHTDTSPSSLHVGPASSPLEAEAVAAEAGHTGTVGVSSVQTPVIHLQREVSPVGRFSPAPGLHVDRTERAVSIAGAMELYGADASAERAASIQNAINSTWTRTFPDGYSIACNITVTYRAAGTSAGTATQIEAARISGPSHVTWLGTRSMTLNANESDAFTWTAAHEFGHIIGLDDRYSESIMSRLGGSATRTATTHAGYERNLMAVSGGVLEAQNVRDVAEENEPSSYWINDDDRVRDWVNAHSIADIGQLSTPNKLRAIRTLMGGWISDADVAAIARICRGVKTSAEANAIRGGIDLLELSSIGQRTAVRVAFAGMP